MSGAPFGDGRWDVSGPGPEDAPHGSDQRGQNTRSGPRWHPGLGEAVGVGVHQAVPLYDGGDPPGWWDLQAGPAQARRVDGLQLVMGHAEHPPDSHGLDAEPGWWAVLPDEGRGCHGPARTFLPVALLRVALRLADTLWRPPGYCLIPDGWLLDVEFLTELRCELVRALDYEDWQPGMRTDAGLMVHFKHAEETPHLAAMVLGPPEAQPRSGTDLPPAFAVVSRRCALLAGPPEARLRPDLRHRETVGRLAGAGLIRPSPELSLLLASGGDGYAR